MSHEPGSWRSVSSFLKFALWPGRSLFWPIFGPTGVVVAVSGYLTGDLLLFILAGLLVLVTLLFLVAGVRLQAERDARLVPRLVLTFKGGQFNTYALPPPQSQQRGEGQYFHIEVSATERVDEVEAAVTELAHLDGSGEYVPERLLAPIPLRWVREPTNLAVTVRPNRPRTITVVLAESHQPGPTLFSTDHFQPMGVPWALSPGEHRIKVFVTGNGVPDASMILDIHADADYTKLRVLEADAG